MADASESKRLRAEIDNNTVKGLFAANGGGAVALLGLLPVVLGEQQYGAFSDFVVAGLLCMQFGIACAVGHNHMRRVCNLEFATKNEWLERFRKKSGFRSWLVPDSCTPCAWSHWWRRLSLAFFLAAGLVVVIGAWTTGAPTESP